MFEFRILGPLEVSDETGPLLLGGLKQRAVLALLLLEAGRVVSQDRLIYSLWGEEPPRTAVTSLQNFVSQLRKTLGPEILETKAPGYRLNVAPGALDLERFNSLLDRSKGTEPDRRAELLREALALWNGPPLADFAFETFAQPHVAQLEELQLATLEERVQADLDAARHLELVGELEGLVEQHPVRERLRAQYMLALYRSGRQAEALHAYQKARGILVEQLGIEPSRELQQLHGAILRQEAGLQATDADPPSEDHFEEVLLALFSGRLVAVLGAEVADLAARLAQRFDYAETGSSLPRVAQYVAVMKGSGPLYDELHALLDADATPTPIHRFFASLPPVLRERGVPHQLLVTTSYDLALEAAFLDAGEEFDLRHVAEAPGEVLSGGERRRTEIARSLIPEPRFILFDEPFAGVDPINVGDLQRQISHLKSRGLGVLITDHNVQDTLGICDRAYIIAQGEILEEGTPQQIASSPRARAVYLGERFRLQSV